jgi:metal-responsive CopG/Arc/MetJ family transcriptional regulator
MKDVHIHIPDELADRLAKIAESLGETRANVVREATAQYVTAKEKEITSREMRRYAEEMAPYSDEFVKETWPAVRKLLLESTEW